MNFDLDESLDLLARTPAVIDRLLRGLPVEWTSANEGSDTWSAIDVVGHLIFGEETDWVPRARIILAQGAHTSFQPFDRIAMFERFAGWPLARLLDRFAELRRENLELVRSWQLSDAQLDLTGLHPEFGSVTLRQLLATWVVHDLTHLAQIVRVLANRYRDDVGPWRAYLSVLDR